MSDMKNFVGVKLVKAKPMTRQEYNDYRNWKLPANEVGTDEGYLIEYQDNFKPNHPDHKGFISWTPKEVFDNAYQEDLGKKQYGYTTEFRNINQYVEYVNVSLHDNGSTILTVRNPDGISTSMNLPPEVCIDLGLFLAQRGIKLGV